MLGGICYCYTVNFIALRARQEAGGRSKELIYTKPFCLAQLGLKPRCLYGVFVQLGIETPSERTFCHLPSFMKLPLKECKLFAAIS
jgi:hypothetical protein